MELDRSRNTYLLFFIPAIIGAFSGNLFNLLPEASIPVSLFQVGLLFGIGATLFYKLFSADFTFRIPPLLIGASIFFAISCFSLIYSGNQIEGLFYLVRVLFTALFGYLLFNAIQSRKDVLFIGDFLIYLSVAVALFGIVVMLSNPAEIAQNITATTQGVKSRAIGVDGDPNVFASYFIFPFFYLLTLFYSKDRILHKFFVGLGILAFLGVIALTYSRSVTLAILVGSVIIIFINRDFKLPIIIFGIFIALLFTSETFRLLLQTVLDRIINLFTETMDNSNETRIILFHGAIDMITESYGFGIGLRGFPVYFASNFDIQKTIGVYEPHNIFYQILAEQGLLGFINFMFLYVITGLTAWRNYQNSNDKVIRNISLALFCSFIGLTIFFNLYGGALLDSRVYILGAIIFGISRLQSERTVSQNA